MSSGYGPIANQRVNATTTIKLTSGEHKTLESGSFVKYVSKGYLPKDTPLDDYDETFQVVVFSQYGMGLVARHSLDWSVY
jgi:hypothetical protein